MSLEDLPPWLRAEYAARRLRFWTTVEAVAGYALFGAGTVLALIGGGAVAALTLIILGMACMVASRW